MGNRQLQSGQPPKEDSKTHHTVALLGLDAAGKTTITYKLMAAYPGPYDCSSMYRHSVWNLDRLVYKRLNVFGWDMGGQTKLRPLWQHYLQHCKAVIWVVDVNDIARLHYDAFAFDNTANVHDELHWVLNQEAISDDVVICIILNKYDLFPIKRQPSLSLDDLQERIGMFQYIPIDFSVLKTVIVDLPDEVIRIIAEYTPTKETGPCEAKRIHIDDLEQNIGYVFSWDDDSKRAICRLICSYLPPYKYVNGRHTKCKVFHSCAFTGEGLQDAFNWVNDEVQAQRTTNKDCRVM